MLNNSFAQAKTDCYNFLSIAIGPLHLSDNDLPHYAHHNAKVNGSRKSSNEERLSLPNADHPATSLDASLDQLRHSATAADLRSEGAMSNTLIGTLISECVILQS